MQLSTVVWPSNGEEDPYPVIDSWSLMNASPTFFFTYVHLRNRSLLFHGRSATSLIDKPHYIEATVPVRIEASSRKYCQGRNLRYFAGDSLPLVQL